MITNISTNFNMNSHYSYLQHFQVAVLNLDHLIQEERKLKRMRKAKVSHQKAA